MNPTYAPPGTVSAGLPRFVYQQCAMSVCHGSLDLPFTHGYLSDGESMELALDASITIGAFAASSILSATRAVASVDDLLRMMNRRPNTQAEYASGDMLSYLRINQAEGSHMLLENGVSHIVLRRDVATRHTAMHEWLHRRLQRQLGHPRPREDEIIEEFLNRHGRYFRLGN